MNLTKFITENVTTGTFTTGLRLLSVTTLRPSSATTTTAALDTNPDEPIDMANPFEKERKLCLLCKYGIIPDYKNVKLLSQFQSSYTGRIYGRHITGLCKQKQAEVEKAIRRAQDCAMMPSYHKDLDFIKDPKLFDPDRPIRPHKY